MGGGEYESWFVSARDPVSPRALWIRHSRLRPLRGPESAALWCTVLDRDAGTLLVVKQVFSAFPRGAEAGPREFRGEAAMGQRTARWDLSITSAGEALRPLRPAALYRSPLPRTKLEATVPDGLVAGTLEAGGREVGVSGWRGTVGRNWGSEHADTWVWLHAADFGGAPDCWLELVLARIRIGRARSPWTAFGALSLEGQRIPLGGFGRRAGVAAEPARLTARVPVPGGRILLSVAAGDEDAVAVSYADPAGGHRAVRHAAMAAVRLAVRRRHGRELILASSHAAYEFGTSQDIRETVPEVLPEG